MIVNVKLILKLIILYYKITNTIQMNIAKDVVNLGENYKYEQELSKLKEKYRINE